jgi:hypothetical protein
MSQLMPLPIAPPPGVVLTETDKAVPGRYTGSNMVRFIRGRAEKRGGWIAYSTTPTLGTPRAFHTWRDVSGNQYLAAGTFEKLYAYDTTIARIDITPYRLGATAPIALAANPLSVVSGSPAITVHHQAHGIVQGDFIYIASATAIGGITPNGAFDVASVIDSNNYVYNFTANATGTVTGGGGTAITVRYEINIGYELPTALYGWGIGGWGLGTWGTPRTSSTYIAEPRVWTLDHFGKLLIASYNGGAIYIFDPTVDQPWPRAAIIANAPTDCRAIFVTPEQFVIALRADMVVAGCSQGDFNTWVPASNNTAFQRTLTVGTRLIGGRALAPFQNLIWSDSAVFQFNYTGSDFVYDSKLLATKCGLIAPGAAVTAGGIAYWMSPDNFWMYDGSVHPIPNVEDVRRYVFGDPANPALNLTNAYQCFANYNPTKNEIEFFYTPNGFNNPYLSMTYSIDNQAWAPHGPWPGGICRASGASPDAGDTRPLMAGTDGIIYQHENTFDANGSPLAWGLTLARWNATQGLMISECQAIEPDFEYMAGTVSIIVTGYDRLNDGAAQSEPLESDTEIATTAQSYLDNYRVTGRYLGLTFTSSDLGSDFRMGTPVAWVKPVGQRP